MLGRHADSLFWMARYLERSEIMLAVSRLHFITHCPERMMEEKNGKPSFQRATLRWSLGTNIVNSL